MLGNIAYRLTAQNPAEAERIWGLTKCMSRLGVMDAALAWKLGSIDPVRARLRTRRNALDRPKARVVHLPGARCESADQSASREALKTGLQGIDRILEQRPERFLIVAGSLLPVMERIDSTLVPEILRAELPRARRWLTREFLEERSPAV